jgi:hypothetical protein
MTKNKSGDTAPASSPVALVRNTKPVSAKARELNGQPGKDIGSPNPNMPAGLGLVLWLMILMLLVKFALILFSR